jgi:RecB family exonuclease
MLLLTGAPAAGPNRHILGQVRDALARGATDFRLLVPTATLAEHLRHELAREGFLLGPQLIQTLARFLQPWTENLVEVSQAALELLVGAVLETDSPEAFRKVARWPGFRARLAALVSEFSSAGCGSRRLVEILREQPVDAPLAPAFLAVCRQVESELERRGWVLRSGLLDEAARRIREAGLSGVRQVLLDGFFSFSPPELALIAALRQHADVISALPRWAGSEPARAALLEMGFAEQPAAPPGSRPAMVLVAAASLEPEAEEIARRILAHVSAGREFRHLGIVLRSPDPYVPVLRTVLERFGIPARFYFVRRLAEHAVVRYLSGIVNALLGGWDHQALLAALRMTASGFAATPACDRFDFAVRERLPGKGLAGLRELSNDARLDALLERLAALEEWREERLPAAEWAARLQTLAALVEPPPVTDGCTHETALLWRSQAAALAAFAAALDEAAAVLEAGRPLCLAEFWEAATLVLREAPLRVPDRRRNVVHVLDVYEARQWELPVVFLPGLLEKQFPLYHSQDPVFPDAARERLRAAGVRLDSTDDRRRQERFLFELAATRATAELVLSYPESNAKGDPNLRSFFLEELGLEPVRARSARPAGGAPRRLGPAVIRSPELLAGLRARHGVFRPTGLEDFLQCPFRFFAGHTLDLAEPPARPDERLDALVQGSIVHRVLAEWQGAGQPREDIFAEVFERVCAEKRVPASCRTELARLRMLEDLRRFAADPPVLRGWSVHVEEAIQFDLAPETGISGRIDRYDVSPEGAAVVFDFKYSSPQGIRDRLRGYDEGQHVQGALYLLGLETRHGFEPAGWLYCGLRKELSAGGWHVPLAGFERTGAGCTAEELGERLGAARERSLDAARQVREGRIEAAPADPDECERCAFRDVCRVRAAEMTLVAAGGAP